MNRLSRTGLIAGSFLAAAMSMTSEAALAASEPATAGGPPIVRRLTPSQYQQIIADVFGPDVKIGGRFEPDIRQDGLLAVGAGHISITVSGLSQYDGMARTIADQAVDKDHRDALIPCKPVNAKAPDDACARMFLSRSGKLLYRRPLTNAELDLRVKAAADAATTLKNFYSGLSLSLAGMLESAPFLFRNEVVEADPDHKGSYRLDAYSKAARLSFFLWNSTPDSALLTAAEKGELNTKRGLQRQAERLLASPRVENGVRAFFIDMLNFDRFASFAKDPMIYPKFTSAAADEAQEQTLRTLVDHLLTRKGDYRNIFTTRKTFLTPLLGSIYSVPVPKLTANGAPDIWVPYEYPEGDPRGVGILTQASFVALHSHPGRSSPTVRGKAVREILLCQKVPDPPGNVNFTVVQDTTNPNYKTARERLKAHATDAMCTGCHKIVDPVGLALENFDSASGFRTTENGAPIDASGALNGRAYTDAAGLGKALHDDPATTGCVITKTYAYATGRAATKDEADWIKYLSDDFAKKGYRYPDLMRTVVTSNAFYRVTPPDTKAAETGASPAATKTAQNQETKK